MVLDRQTKMGPAEVDALLARHETGVLTLAQEDEPYAIPISYGYHSSARQFYLRLVSTPDSEKRQFLTSSPQTRLVIYEEEEPAYRSVVADGTLEQVNREDLTVEHIEQYGEAKRPLFEIWADAKRNLDIQLFKLDPEELSGRMIEIDREQE